jgi:hypothetical protein
MDGKRLLAFCLVMVTVLAFVQPADALLWPPVIGTCGFGGLFGPFSCGFPLGFGFGWGGCGFGWGGCGLWW